MKNVTATGHHVLQQVAVENRALYKRQRSMVLQVLTPTGAQVVQHHDLRPQRQQRIGQMRTDEPRPSRDHDPLTLEESTVQTPPVIRIQATHTFSFVTHAPRSRNAVSTR